MKRITSLHSVILGEIAKYMTMNERIKKLLRRPYCLFGYYFFDPLQKIRIIKGFPFFVRNLLRYNRLNRNKAFAFRLSEVWCCSHDRFSQAGAVQGHYFYQDLWAARILFDRNTNEHVDVGSRVDGFIAHILPFCRVYYVNIRPLNAQLKGFEICQGSITQMQ